jgi:Ice-binding-like
LAGIRTGSATLGTTITFAGNILALDSVTLTTGATILCGRAFAQNGAVTMDTNTISNNCATFDNGSGRSDFGSVGFSDSGSSDRRRRVLNRRVDTQALPRTLCSNRGRHRYARFLTQFSR